LKIVLKEEEFFLTAEKALVHPATRTAFLADLHLGKSTHFRKSGIATPAAIIHDEIVKLAFIIKKYNLQNLYFLGDLFHSHLNNEWSLFEDFLEQHHTVNFILVKGNHDILPESLYNKNIITVVKEPYLFRSITLSHHPIASAQLKKNSTLYNIAGHIHPGVVVRGKGRSALKLPCYHQKEQQLILPAFGRFTGVVKQSGKTGDETFYAIVHEKVIAFNTNN